MNPNQTKQLPADWQHYFDWLNLTVDEFLAQTAYWDMVSYLNAYAIPAPVVELENMPYGAKEGPVLIITIGPNSYRFNGFGAVMNPVPVVTQLQADRAIPQGFVAGYVPPSHKPAPVKQDLSDLTKAVGQIVNGYDKETRELVYTFQGKVPIGTPVTYQGRDFVLVDSGSPWNRTGVWQIA